MTYTEHKIEELKECADLSKDKYEYYFPKKRDNQLCFSAWKEKEDEFYKIRTGYFIGVDWIEENIKYINIQPKVNFDKSGNIIREVDYLKMLFSCLKHNETAKLISDLIIVKWDNPQIEIEQKHDMLTPFIIIDFLNIVKIIVKKGLKKSYYKITKTLNGKIKGKMLIKKTMNIHLSKGHMLYNVCTYDEFGINNKENKILKLALEYINQYMLSSPLMQDAYVVSDIVRNVSPAFEQVSSDIDVGEIKQMKSNTLFREYDNGIRLAKMILKRFAYNISNTAKRKIFTPPFWIDMPMLFELHVLSLLKDSFSENDVDYHLSTHGNELDFLLKAENCKMVIDAKYIPSWKWNVIHDNVRQISGYARLTKVYNSLSIEYPESIDCLVIYPDIENGKESIIKDGLKKDMEAVKGYQGFFKLGVKIPIISNGQNE